jgi:hypothetical protein
MAKDPAFLFYSKDWLEGTGEMTPEEKGVYIDLLAHQHQKGSLPPETKRLAKLVGLSETEFLSIWVDLALKFEPNGSGRLVNRRLSGIVTERLDKGWRNKIIGTLASVVRLGGQTAETNFIIKKKFKVDDFLGSSDHNLTKTVTEWYDKCLKSIANANEDVIPLGNRGAGEKGFVQFPLPEHFNGFPEIRIGGIKELISITKKVDLLDNDVRRMWEVFKVQSLTGKKFYQDDSAVYSHFTNWIKMQNFKTIVGAVNKNGILEIPKDTDYSNPET